MDEKFPREIYPQKAPRKKVSLAKPPERTRFASSSFRNTEGRKKVSLEKRPEDGIYINPNPVHEIQFPDSPMPTIDTASAPPLTPCAPPPATAATQMPSITVFPTNNNIATAVGATITDPDLTAAREGRGIIIKQGSFRCAYNAELVWLLATAIPALVLFGTFAVSVSNDIVKLFDNIFAGICMGWITLSLISSAVFYGKNYHFSAERDAFVISRRNKKRYYYYSDITNVRFEEFTLFGKKRGYVVTIETRYNTDVYRFIFGDNRIFTDATNTPFYYLMRNAQLTNAPENNTPDPDRFLKRSYDPDEY